ncbi:MAG TPA: chromate transporter [Anaerolineales bacterium]|nr:chromate transporter [Anaerolineales bacterium]HRF49682.1 chromate transporter [Anaerolineales bacterium]
MSNLWELFLTFLKINLLSPSGPASLGVLYSETVGKLITEDQFVEAAAFSRFLPGSDALQLAVFVGYSAAGLPGALVATTAAILPPTVIMLGVAALLQRLRGETWINGFVQGITPALAVVMVLVAIEMVREGRTLSWREALIGAAALAALLFKVSPVIVLIGAGILGVLLYR